MVEFNVDSKADCDSTRN